MKPENYRKKIGAYDTDWLKKKAIINFNAFIRERDKDEPCISCGEYRDLCAGHYWAAGNYESVRFNEVNVNGQCEQCNGHLHGNLILYGKGLVKKYGQEEVDELDIIIGLEKQIGYYKRDRFTLIEIIMKYKFDE